MQDNLQRATRLADIPEWELRTFCSASGMWASWRDLADLLAEIDQVPFRNRAQWIDEQEQILDRMNLGATGHRVIGRALAASAHTVVGRAVAEHELLKFSSQLNYWLSRSVVPNQE